MYVYACIGICTCACMCIYLYIYIYIYIYNIQIFVILNNMYNIHGAVVLWCNGYH